MLLILAPSASSWSEKPKSTLGLEFELPHGAGLEFPCSIQMAPRHLWYVSEWAWGRRHCCLPLISLSNPDGRHHSSAVWGGSSSGDF